MQYVGPASYDPRVSDNINSKIEGNKCSAVFSRRPGNIESFINPQEYVVINQSIKHLPILKTAERNASILKITQDKPSALKSGYEQVSSLNKIKVNNIFNT